MALLHLYQVKVQIRSFGNYYKWVSIEQNQSTYANHNIGKLDNNQGDMLNDNIENKMSAPTQEVVNDVGELIYEYM